MVLLCSWSVFSVGERDFCLRSLFGRALRATRDRSEEKAVSGGSFSILYRHGAQLVVDLLEQRDIGISSRQRNPHLPYRDADQRADL